MHFHVTLRCVNDLPNYIQGLFHLKNNGLSNRKTKVTLNLFILSCLPEKQFCVTSYQGLIKTVFDISISILSTLIWAGTNLILSKTETTIKRNSGFFIKSAT